MTLAAGAKLSDRFETQAAAQQVDRELRERLADMVYEDRSALAVNFATEKKDATEEEGRK